MPSPPVGSFPLPEQGDSARLGSRTRAQEGDRGGKPRKSPWQIALAALARREYGRAELERLLLRKLGAGEESEGESTAEAIPDEVARTLDRLQEQGFLSDVRLAQAWTRSRGARYGRLRLRQELARKGVDDAAISAALPSADEEARAALALWRKKFGRPAETPQERARQGRFLVARGFDVEVVRRIVSGTTHEAI